MTTPRNNPLPGQGPTNSRNQPGYAETEKTETLRERRSEVNWFFAAIFLAVPVVLFILSMMYFSGKESQRVAQMRSLKPTPYPTLAAPVNDAGGTSPRM